jgi:hypothetical protein
MAGGTPAIRMAGKMLATPEEGIRPALKNTGWKHALFDAS